MENNFQTVHNPSSLEVSLLSQRAAQLLMEAQQADLNGDRLEYYRLKKEAERFFRLAKKGRDH
jgi:hypothetical protein